MATPLLRISCYFAGSISMKLITQCADGNTKNVRCVGSVPKTVFQRSYNQIALHSFQRLTDQPCTRIARFLYTCSGLIRQHDCFFIYLTARRQQYYCCWPGAKSPRGV